MFRDHENRVMLEDEHQITRLFAVYEGLAVDTPTLVTLIEASDEYGSPLLNRILKLSLDYPDYVRRILASPWFHVYAACIAKSRKLPDDAKVRILRACMPRLLSAICMRIGHPCAAVSISADGMKRLFMAYPPSTPCSGTGTGIHLKHICASS
jgi:hypothetical protein